MTKEEIARFEQVLREADRIRQEIALDEALYSAYEGSPEGLVYELEHYSYENAPLLAA